MEKQLIISKTFLQGILLILVLISGFIIHWNGKPWNILFFTIHKLSYVLFVVCFIKFFIKYFKAGNPDILQYIFLVICLISMFALLISGGFMSLDKHQPFMNIIHIIGFLFLIICLLICYIRIPRS